VNFEPIGTIESPVREAVDENWGSIESKIHLESSFASGLQGIDGFSHIIVVFFMHQSTFEPASDLVRLPQGRPDMPQIGIFAQRAKHRPNPIGITTVRLIEVDGNVLKVKGLDAIDGTPVLDIKPYFPAYDRVQGAVIPEWVERLMKGYF
jgi:tRNA-Thr(GGU) m(6)t(6)A37 methyltransferase TsaA